MDLIKFLKIKLNKNKRLQNGEVYRQRIVDRSDKFNEIFPIQENITFESPVITNISNNDFIDATAPLNIAKYKNNLELLIKKVKEDKEISNYVIIRNDDHLPDDWVWRVTSKDTSLDLSDIIVKNTQIVNVSYQIRLAFAEKNMKAISFNKNDYNKVLNDELAKIDKNIGKIYIPSHFRSTKHFTINTPLASTLEYNWVNSDRNFHVIDTIDNFLNSGYGYSLAYKDAYLDITHEGLPISQDAVIFISEEKFNKILSNDKIMLKLKERRIIKYRGDSSLAINMYLTEIGILPTRPGNLYKVYDEETLNILNSSIQKISLNNNLLCNQSHGGIYGHFTALLDQYYKYDNCQTVIDFLKMYFLQNNIIIKESTLTDINEFCEFIQNYDINRLLQVINLYNNIMMENVNKSFAAYKDNRKEITPEISCIFRTTLKAIIEYSKTYYIYNDESELFPFIKTFYFSNSVQEQLLAATIICRKLGISIEEINTSNYNKK